MQKIVLAGGSGFLGRTLAKWYRQRNFEVVILSRSNQPMTGARVVYWDGANPGDWAREIDGADILVNLSGRSVNCRYTARNRKQMMDSRILSTGALAAAIANCSTPPPVWLNSSTATIYKHTYGDAHNELGETGATPQAKDAFSIEIANAWESAFTGANVPATRKVTLRTAMVFGNEPGGVFEVLHRLARFGLGGHMGDGRQYVSWIHAEDFCRALDWLVNSNSARGIYNICAPNPLTNAAMMSLLRADANRSFGLPAGKWMLEAGALFLRTETELILKSRRIIPGWLLSEGFEFLYPDMQSATSALRASMASQPEPEGSAAAIFDPGKP